MQLWWKRENVAVTTTKNVQFWTFPNQKELMILLRWSVFERLLCLPFAFRHTGKCAMVWITASNPEDILVRRGLMIFITKFAKRDRLLVMLNE
jgi:hypothetical protein